MGRPKAGLVLEGQTLLDRALSMLSEAGCRPLYAVVAGAAGRPARPGRRS